MTVVPDLSGSSDDLAKSKFRIEQCQCSEIHDWMVLNRTKQSFYLSAQSRFRAQPSFDSTQFIDERIVATVLPLQVTNIKQLCRCSYYHTKNSESIIVRTFIITGLLQCSTLRSP